jgi:hypothetical protein
MPNAIMLSVIMMRVVMLNVVAPFVWTLQDSRVITHKSLYTPIENCKNYQSFVKATVVNNLTHWSTLNAAKFVMFYATEIHT